MKAVATQVNNELRRHWKASLGFALLIGLVAGTVFATIAGARRTETAYDRYLTEANAEDVMIAFFAPNDPQFQATFDLVSRIPQVEAIAVTAPMIAVPSDRIRQFQDFQAGVDSQYLYETNRPKLVAGRLPDPTRADEVMLNVAAAKTLDVGVGDTFELRAETEAEYYAAPLELDTAGELRTFTVAGIGVLPGEVVPMAPFDGTAAVVFTPAYYAAHPDEAFNYSYLHVRLHGGAADIDAFRSTLSAQLIELGVPVTSVPFIDAGARQAKVNRSIEPQAQALLIFGVILALVGFLVLGRLLSRHLLLDESDRRQLWSLGFSNAQLLVVAAIRVLAMLLLAAAIATAFAVFASNYFPIGPARLAERHTGIAVNVAVLAIGAFALIVLFLVGACVSVARSLPHFGTAAVGPGPASPSRPSRIATMLANIGAPATSVVGVRMALERGRGRTAVPVVGALVATSLALGALTAAVTFGGNLERLVTTPSLYGLEWDVAVGNGFQGLPLEESKAILDHDPDVAAWSAGSIGELRLTAEGDESPALPVPAIGIDTFGSDVYPRVIKGRAVREEDEIVLGQHTAGRLHVNVGDFVTTQDLSGTKTTLEVVGIAVFPGVGRAIFDSTDLDEGAAVMPVLLEDPFLNGGRYTTYFVRYRAGTDQQVANERLRGAFLPIDSDCQFLFCVVTDQKPGGIRNYEEVRSTPLVLAGVLALLAVATLATTLATSVRRRRRDFAVLQSLGFVRRQVAATTAWQATTVALVALLIGLPLGILGGRTLWTRFSDSIGVSVTPQVPIIAILVAIPVTILLSIAIAFLPGRFAARTNAAQTLRTG
ncbi:MAG: FtsX-like permease family protein [Actinomycetia bacterium]|nr:FtsX-like permease family protein [Actinomycetes bacterium]